MIAVSELWPAVMPDKLLEVDAVVTQQLGKMAVLPPDAFSPEERSVLQLTVEPNCNDRIAASILNMEVKDVKEHRDAAVEKSGLTMHGLVYVGHHSGWLTWGGFEGRRPPQVQSLSPMRAVILKFLATGMKPPK